LSKKLYPYCIVLVGSRNGLAPSLNIVNTIKSCKRFKLTLAKMHVQPQIMMSKMINKF